MSQYEFAWPFPAGEVFVTGTFDNWTGSVKMHKNSDGIFSAVVDMGGEVEKVFYKYIVDGNWTVNNAARKENDLSGIENNVLYKHEMKTPAPTIVEEPPKEAEETPEPVAEPTAQVATEPVESQTETVTILPVAPEAEDVAAQVDIFTSSAAPVSTTAELAAQVPLVKNEEKAVTESTEVQDEIVEQTFSISPLPASTTPGNPIHLEPGEPVPKFIVQNAANTVNLDEESYEKADASNFGVPAESPSEEAEITPTPEEPEVVPTSAEIDTPDATVEPVAPEVPAVEETPAASVPEVVQESLAVAHASPEASASDVAVEQKHKLEEELVTQPPHLHHAETHLTTGIITEGVAPIVLAAPAVQKSVEAPIQVHEVVQESQPEPEVKAIPSELVAENQPPLLNGAAANRAPLTTPPAAPPTTSTFTTPVPGTTFNVSATTEKPTSSSSTISSNCTSHKVVSEKNEEASAALKDKVPEKKKEKRRSVILNKIRNVFKPEQERGISILVSAVMCLLAASLLAGKFEWRSMMELRGRAG